MTGGKTMQTGHWQRDPSWIAAEFDDNLVMLDVESGNYFGMNRTAAAIWEILQEPQTTDAVVDRLRSRFDVPAEQCEAAVERALGKLQDIGAVRAQPAP